MPLRGNILYAPNLASAEWRSLVARELPDEDDPIVIVALEEAGGEMP
jgi:hypothetical protein